ncbi:MAG: hypothetical protein EOP47_25545, partial [Sphingobacteriaceae bacterium]
MVLNYQAALALLSRVYLYKGDWAQVVAKANQVTTDNTFTLATATNYQSVFVNFPDANPQVEMLFELSNKGYLKFSLTDIGGIFS